MAKKLVIVESPAKARTLGKFLGPSYVIKASLGHVRDLPKASLGVDTENDFAPTYVIPQQKRRIIREIKEAASDASSIYLATDPDREGEAISWHLVEAAKLRKDRIPIRRVAFHEITDEAIGEAFKSPRPVDMNLVNAQQARRILDRLVGYKLSPLLWRKVQRGLSAGRVQSVAVRMIVDREREIQDFVPEEYWTIEVELCLPEEEGTSFRAKLTALSDGTKLHIGNKQEADEAVATLEEASYVVKEIHTKRTPRQPAPPFITSTLQQEAWRKLHFTAKRTMVVAQQLYEGLPVGEEGSVGLITYMRTDSTHVSPSAITEARDFIKEKYGSDFLPPMARLFAKKTKWAQEAHEAIRPTKVHREPKQVKQFLDSDQSKLYDLIWKRMVASQMSPALYDITTAEIQANPPPPKQGYLLKAIDSTMRFPGFTAVYSEGKDEDDEGETFVRLPRLESGDRLSYLGSFPDQQFTQPPPRYTEATLIRALEEKGIGRPSTYAPILSTIQERDYVHKADGRFHPEELGTVVNDILSEHFPNIVNLGFTAEMEQRLDEIARGKQRWIPVLRAFYTPFEVMLKRGSAKIQKVDVSKATDEICPDCGRPMVIRVGRFGKFLACSGYPECKRTMRFLVKTGIPCPECGGELVERVNKKKQVFYGCSSFPRCQFTTRFRPIPQPCPSCGKLLVLNRKDWARCTACGQKLRLSELESAKQEEAKSSRGSERRSTRRRIKEPSHGVPSPRSRGRKGVTP
jgi:DNA topoisomerase-1